MIQSLFVYTLLFGTMLAFAIMTSKLNGYTKLANGEIKQKSFWSFATIFPLLLFAVIFGMRYNVGTDYLSYLYSYIYNPDKSRFEFLFSNITKLLRDNDVHFSVYFGILAFIQVFFFFLSFNNQRYLFPFLIFFLAVNEEWLNWMNIIRQAIAMCIWLYSLKYIEQRKFWKYFFWIVIAFGFHKSAVVLLIFYPLLKRGSDYFKNIPLQLILLTAALVVKTVFLSYIHSLDSLVSFYGTLIGDDSMARSYNADRLSESFNESSGSGIAAYFKLFLNVIVILYSVKLKAFYNNKWFNMIYFFFFFGLLIYSIIPTGAIVLSRPFRYFYIFKTIIYAYFGYFLYRTKKIEFRLFFFYFLIITFLGIFYLSQITSNPDGFRWYKFFFEV